MRLIWKLLKWTVILLVVFVGWSMFRANTPVTAFRREIVVNVPREVAWEHFSRPSDWVSWLGSAGAPTEVTPAGAIRPDTVARFGQNVTFRMTQFQPPEHWMWSSEMGALRIDYDHIFEPLGDRQTRMVFHQTVTGFGNDVMALFLRAVTWSMGHQAALDRLAGEMNRLPAASN